MPQPDRRGSRRQPGGAAMILRTQRGKPSFQVGREITRGGVVGSHARSHDHIQRGNLWQDEAPHMLAHSAPQPVPVHGGTPQPRNHDTESRMPEGVRSPEDVESARAAARARGQHRPNLLRSGETPVPREPLGRQAAPCLEGRRTARRLRPFLRRRLSTSRPQRVFMRARKPCLRMRRLFRGR
jgi:hypothetical protein